jgi:hypothetical protein
MLGHRGQRNHGGFVHHDNIYGERILCWCRNRLSWEDNLAGDAESKPTTANGLAPSHFQCRTAAFLAGMPRLTSCSSQRDAELFAAWFADQTLENSQDLGGLAGARSSANLVAESPRFNGVNVGHRAQKSLPVDGLSYRSLRSFSHGSRPSPKIPGRELRP